MESAFECRCELESFHKSLADMSVLSHSLSLATEADTEMSKINTQLQQMKIGQHHASIKLPKIEIPMFNGEKTEIDRVLGYIRS